MSPEDWKQRKDVEATWAWQNRNQGNGSGGEFPHVRRGIIFTISSSSPCGHNCAEKCVTTNEGKET